MPDVECFEAIDNALQLLRSDAHARRRLEWCGLVLGKSCREWSDIDLKREFGDLTLSVQKLAEVAANMFEIANGPWKDTPQMAALRGCAAGIVDRLNP